jgi:hypothetical protein
MKEQNGKPRKVDLPMPVSWQSSQLGGGNPPALLSGRNTEEFGMQSGSNKQQVDVMRLRADLAAAGIEVLSAHCATDRVRLQYSPQDIVTFGEHSTLRKAIASCEALCRFFAQIQAQMNHKEESSL